MSIRRRRRRAEPEPRTVETDNPCDGCELNGTSRKSKAKIPAGAKYLIVTKAPTARMLRQGEHLAEKAAKLLGSYLGKAGFKRKEFAFVSSVRCAFDQDLFKAPNRKAIEKNCKRHLDRVIGHVGPELIIPLGADAAKAVAGRAVKITKARGVVEHNKTYDAYVMPMLDPFMVQLHPQHRPIFDSDCKTLRRLKDYDYDTEAVQNDVLGEYELIEDLQFLIDRKPELLSFDVETTGLRWAEPGSKILTMQFSTQPGEGYLLSWDHPEKPTGMRRRRRILRQLKELLQAPHTSIVGQNLKFDASWVLDKFGFKFRMDHDTLMMAATYDENMQTKDLDTLTKIYAPAMAGYADAFNATYDKSRMDLVPLSELVGYGAGDVDAGIRVFIALRDLLMQDPKLWNGYRRVSMPGINAFLSMETRGLLLNNEYFDQFEETLSESVEEQYQALISQVPRSIKRKHLECNKDPRKALSFSRRDFLVDILFAHEDGFKLKPKEFTKSTRKLERSMRVPSTSTKDHLPYFYEECPFAEELSAYIKSERVLSTNVRSFRQKYVIDKYIYPVYSLAQAVTGRCLTEDAKIVTNFGTMTMGAIGREWGQRRNPGNGLIKVVSHTGRLRSVVDFIHNGTREVFEVTTSQGYKLKATANHPFWTPTGWVELSELLEGDTVHTYAFDYAVGEEEWRVVEEDSRYSVSSLGRVRGPRGVLRPFKKGEWGHTQVALGRGKYRPVHKLVAATFLGPKPEGTETLHRNGLPADNRPSNLKYGTSKENSAHAIAHGRSRRGEVHEGSRYSDAQVREIRELHNDGMAYEELEVRTGICRSYVRELCMYIRRKEPVEILGTDTVVSIISHGYQPTYDISVDKDHSFVANNLVVHNTSSRDPNGQNFPKRGKVAKAYRKIFVPPPGWVMLEADLSQAELRISGDMANDPTMIRIYREGGDIHAMTAAGTMSMTLERFLQGKHSAECLATVVRQWPGADQYLRGLDPEQRPDAKVRDFVAFKRFQAKAINFGFIYGMGWRKFIGYAKTQYGVEFTESQAQDIRRQFFATYGRLLGWHKSTRDQATEDGMVRSYSGRVRHLPMIWSDDEGVAAEAQRQAINSPVQEFASTLGVISLSRVDQEVNPEYLKIVGFVHDAIYALVPLRHLEWGAKTLKHYMESNPLKEWFDLDLKVPIVADVGFGMNGGETHEMEGLELDQPFDFSTVPDIGFRIPRQVVPPRNGRIVQPEHMRIHA